MMAKPLDNNFYFNFVCMDVTSVLQEKFSIFLLVKICRVHRPKANVRRPTYICIKICVGKLFIKTIKRVICNLWMQRMPDVGLHVYNNFYLPAYRYNVRIMQK